MTYIKMNTNQQHPEFVRRTIIKLVFCLSGITLLLCAGFNRSSVITMETLLLDMTNREQLAQFPEPEYTCKQFSSFSRTSKKPGDYTWFGNLDNNYFLRTENNQG